MEEARDRREGGMREEGSGGVNEGGRNGEEGDWGRETGWEGRMIGGWKRKDRGERKSGG